MAEVLKVLSTPSDSLRKMRALILILALFVPAGHAIPLYSQREGVSCLYCHTTQDRRSLNHAGELYRDSGHYFPFLAKPLAEEKHPDSFLNPRYQAIRERYMRKWFKDDPEPDFALKGQQLFYGSATLRRKSEKTCASCHSPQDLSGVHSRYPRYVPSAERMMSLEQMQNYCLTEHLGGEPLPLGSDDSLAISAYLKGLSQEQHAASFNR